jgi:hypothetical protein
MKGLAPVIIALGAAVIVLVTEAFLFNTFIEQRITREAIARETEFLQGVDKVEMVKRGLPFALYYSLKEALRKNGYSSVSNITDVNSFEKEVEAIFIEYAEASKEEIGVTVPAGNISISLSGDLAEIKFTSSSMLKYNSTWFEIFDNPNITISVKGSELVE